MDFLKTLLYNNLPCSAACKDVEKINISIFKNVFKRALGYNRNNPFYLYTNKNIILVTCLYNFLYFGSLLVSSCKHSYRETEVTIKSAGSDTSFAASKFKFLRILPQIVTENTTVIDKDCII